MGDPRPPMEDLAWLTLLQLHDSAYPIGAFAHSNGLERYAALGMRAEGLEAYLRAQLRLGFGRLDIAALALAYLASEHDGTAELAELATTLNAWKVVPSLRATSLALGRRTLKVAARSWPEAAARVELAGEARHHPLVVGRLARWLDLPLRPTALAFAQGSLASALSAATRCLPLGPERAQALLSALQPALIEGVTNVLQAPADALWSATPAADLRALQQPQMPSRMFES
jgi:urease accessory protein